MAERRRVRPSTLEVEKKVIKKANPSKKQAEFYGEDKVVDKKEVERVKDLSEGGIKTKIIEIKTYQNGVKKSKLKSVVKVK